MKPTRFDTISKLFASRKTRRTAVTGGLGLAAAAMTGRALAQEGTPGAWPDDPHPSADETRAKTEFLFVQPFDAGTWAPKAGEEGAYTLTLDGAAANTVYFSDRPERIVGLAETQTFLDGLGFTPENPPNAAIVAQREGGEGQETLVIELLNPQYDGDTLTYDARVLADYGEHGLAHLASQQQDYDLPESFGEGGLFIDDCPTWYVQCMNQVGTAPVGYVVYPLCWNAQKNACVACGPTAFADVCQMAWPLKCSGSGCDVRMCDPDVAEKAPDKCQGPCAAPEGGSC